MKQTLQERLVRYFEKHPGEEMLGAEICRKASEAMKVTGGSVERRLRILAEVGEWPLTINDTPEHTRARELLAGGKVTRRKINGLVHFTYTPPAVRQVRRVIVENGVAKEIIETIKTLP